MAIRIADCDGAWEIEVPLEGAVIQSLRAQLCCLDRQEEKYWSMVERIGKTFSSSIIEVLDPELRPPSEAQVSFALAIAKELNVNIPGEVLIFTSAMGDFLDRYSQLYYSRRKQGHLP
jgi:hypothetical protein